MFAYVVIYNVVFVVICILDDERFRMCGVECFVFVLLYCFYLVKIFELVVDEIIFVGVNYYANFGFDYVWN